jgi:hypothetical protein
MNTKALKAALMTGRLSVSNEYKMQAAIEKRLVEGRFNFEREKTIKAGRIDFVVDLEGFKVCIECKVDGSETAAFRQCMRYALTGEFDFIVIITGQNFIGMMEQFSVGKKIVPVEVWKVRTL